MNQSDCSYKRLRCFYDNSNPNNMWVLVLLISLLKWRFGSTTAECGCADAKLNQGDYYWREYFGIIPEDAVEAGFTETGNKTYVGQMASYKYIGLYPVFVIPGMKGGTGTIGEKVHEDTYVKVLCSPRNKDFEWKTTTVSDMHLLTDYHLVIGGVQNRTITYIGRANSVGQVQIGRVLTKEETNGLRLFDKAGVQEVFQTFEMLVLPRKQ